MDEHRVGQRHIQTPFSSLHSYMAITLLAQSDPVQVISHDSRGKLHVEPWYDSGSYDAIQALPELSYNAAPLAWSTALVKMEVAR